MSRAFRDFSGIIWCYPITGATIISAQVAHTVTATLQNHINTLLQATVFAKPDDKVIVEAVSKIGIKNAEGGIRTPMQTALYHFITISYP